MFGRKKKDFDISLEDLEVTGEDLGTTWHPHYLSENELLEDVSEEMMMVHFAKDERLSQPDATEPLESIPVDEIGETD